MSSAASPVSPVPVLAAWEAQGCPWSPLGDGLINQTFAVEGPRGRFVLQCLNPMFSPEVNLDIEAVTHHLAARGQLTPRLLRTAAGAPWFEHAGRTWRALSWIDGVTPERVENADQAAEAGRVLASFHVALRDFDHEFCSQRLGVHDTARHLTGLRQALADHRSHRHFALIAPLGRRILAAAEKLPVLPELPQRIVHGDPKIGNILFSHDRRQALCLVDLDTLAAMPLPLELGDALRSWCNPGGEDGARAEFSLDLFEAALDGYARVAGEWLSAAERESIVAATQIIQIELAARFCADALNESYFGWDSRRFASASEHNRLRAGRQLAASESLQRQAVAAGQLVQAAFG